MRGAWAPTSRAIIQNWRSKSAVKLNRVTWSERGHDVVLSFAYSPDGHRLAICCSDSTTVDVRLADQSTNIFRILHGDTVQGAAFSRDRRWLATASVDRTALICDARTGQQRFMLEHEYAVLAVAFSHDSRLLATAGTPVYVWDVRTGKELHRLWTEPESLNNLVTGVAFSSDDRWLAGAGGDMTVRVWDPHTGAQLVKITHDNAARSVVFDPSGRWLANSTDDGRVHIWQLHTDTHGHAATL
jgi:WD40 repeat protein